MMKKAELDEYVDVKERRLPEVVEQIKTLAAVEARFREIIGQNERMFKKLVGKDGETIVYPGCDGYLVVVSTQGVEVVKQKGFEE
jgi:hypothetical protein